MSDEPYTPAYYQRLQDGYLNHKPWVWKRIEVILGYLRPEPGDTILETGCGQGTVAYELAVRCRHLCAVDRHPDAIEASRRFLDRVGGLKNVLLAQADLEALPFPAGSFGKVNFSEVVEHLHRPDVVLRELHRVLRRGGTMTVTTWPNKAHVIWSWRYRHGRGSPEDFNPQSPRSLRSLLTRSGFEVLDMRLTNFYVHIPRTRWELDGCSEQSSVARFCERVLTRRPWGDYLAASINLLCRKV